MDVTKKCRKCTSMTTVESIKIYSQAIHIGWFSPVNKYECVRCNHW